MSRFYAWLLKIDWSHFDRHEYVSLGYNVKSVRWLGE